MSHNVAIEIGLKNGIPHNEIARKIYLGYPTKVFIGNEEREFQIINSISCFFNIPYTSIQVVGSAKTGESYYKKTTFNNSTSDLDIAIVDRGLYFRYMELVFEISNGYSDRAKFTKRDTGSNFQSYTNYLSKGIFRPDLMPSCTEKADWWRFFSKISKENKDLFKSVNAGIYASQVFFEYKQKSSIVDFKILKGL